MAAGYAFLLLSVALIFGAACVLLHERFLAWLRDGRWLERRRNALLNRRALELFVEQRDAAQTVTRFRDPLVDAAIARGDWPAATKLTTEGLHRSFESGNEDQMRLYEQYMRVIASAADSKN